MKRYDILATHTRTFDHKPLVALDGGPFNGVEMTPADLEQLAYHQANVLQQATPELDFGAQS